MGRKPMLTIPEQILHLKAQGVTFARDYSEAEAKRYLTENNNFFRLILYRSSFESSREEGQVQYRNLDFSYLVDLAVIDFHLRDVLLSMTLNIEHYVKMRIMRATVAHDEDGYAIVGDYVENMSFDEEARYRTNLDHLSENDYLRDIYNDHEDAMPIWVFFELISFGELTSFCQFAARRLGEEELKRVARILKDVNAVRNATAHNNCLLNNLRQEERRRQEQAIEAALDQIRGCSATKARQMNNPRVRQIVSTLFLHRELVDSEGVRRAISVRLHELVRRFGKRNDYSRNVVINNTFAFLSCLIDAWFPVDLLPERRE